MSGGNHGAVLAGAALTFVGVPAGLALTGGNVDGVMTFTLAVLLAGAMLLVRPVAADRPDRLGAERGRSAHAPS